MNTQSRLEPENEVSPPGDVAALDRSPERAQRPWLKPLAFAIVPALVVLAGVYMWFASSGHESTDNAYVQQNVISISSEVGGRIVEVAVRENQRIRSEERRGGKGGVSMVRNRG